MSNLLSYHSFTGRRVRRHQHGLIVVHTQNRLLLERIERELVDFRGVRSGRLQWRVALTWRTRHLMRARLQRLDGVHDYAVFQLLEAYDNNYINN